MVYSMNQRVCVGLLVGCLLLLPCPAYSQHYDDSEQVQRYQAQRNHKENSIEDDLLTALIEKLIGGIFSLLAPILIPVGTVIAIGFVLHLIILALCSGGGGGDDGDGGDGDA